jgi:hypothetical protein
MPFSRLRLCFLVLVASLALLATPALAEKYALILAIADYVRSPLPGVTKDIENASQIARLMGVPEKNISIRHDGELAGPALVKALDDFSARITSADQVFVYYSGHGSSYTKHGAPGVCEKALVTPDITMVPKEVFNKKISLLAERAQKTFVFLDSCYSGGLVDLKKSRALGLGETSPLRGKFTAASSSDPCSIPSNLVKGARDFDMVVAEKQPNYYLLGAAAENELAIDGGKDLGGFASSSLLYCLQNPAEADRDKDGVVSLEEAKVCAQDVVNKRLAQGKASDPNFQYSSMTLTSGHGQGGNTPLVFVGAQASVVNTPAFVRSLFEGRDGKRNVTLSASKNPVRLGEDITMTVTSDRPGYLTLMVVGSSGKIYKIFPNKLDAEARIEPGMNMPVPRPGSWRMPASPPVGDNWFLALVSDTPDRFRNLGDDAGIFKALGNSGGGAKGLFDFLFGNASAAPAEGTALANPEANSDRYGAALLKVVEIN